MSSDEETPLTSGPNSCESVSLKDAGRAAMVRLDFGILAGLLQLPPAAEIDDARTMPDEPSVLHVRIRGAGWPVRVGWRIPQATAKVTTYRNDEGECFKTVIDWNFPQPIKVEDHQP